jgi:DNA-binding MarR family transcriptional regulator
MPSRQTPRTRDRAAPKRATRRAGAKREGSASSRASLELETLQAFRTIFGSARLHDAEVRRTARISGSQLWALSEIARVTGMSVNALSKCMALHQTTASNLVNALVERDLIRRIRDSGDQRVVQLHVTAEGKRMLERAPGPHAGLLVDALRRLDGIELAALRQYLQLLVAAMKRPAANAAGETLLGE